MGIRIEYGLDDDKLPHLNKKSDCELRNYIPQILRINFIDEKTDNIVFTFVPKLEDRDTIALAFDLLLEYDQKRIAFVKFLKDNWLNKNIIDIKNV